MSDPVMVEGELAIAEDGAIAPVASPPDQPPPDRIQFMRLHLLPDLDVLLPIHQLSEVLSMETGQIVPIPHMPPWVMGLYNWRGEILWTVDLGHLCGRPPWYQQSGYVAQHSAVVLHHQPPQERAFAPLSRAQYIGLVVNRVEGMEWCNPNEFQPPTSGFRTPSLERFLRGYWCPAPDHALAVLDGDELFNSITATP